jgi:hypothetical protein
LGSTRKACRGTNTLASWGPVVSYKENEV